MRASCASLHLKVMHALCTAHTATHPYHRAHRTLSCMKEAGAAAAALKFNATLVAMADAVLAGMRSAGAAHFNGAHLRLENDAIDWARVLGGRRKYLSSYAAAFKAAGFNRTTHMYAASGLLSYGATDDMRRLQAFVGPFSTSVQVGPGCAGRGAPSLLLACMLTYAHICERSRMALSPCPAYMLCARPQRASTRHTAMMHPPLRSTRSCTCPGPSWRRSTPSSRRS